MGNDARGSDGGGSVPASGERVGGSWTGRGREAGGGAEGGGIERGVVEEGGGGGRARRRFLEDGGDAAWVRLIATEMRCVRSGVGLGSD